VHKSVWHLTLAQVIHRGTVAKVYKLLRIQNPAVKGNYHMLHYLVLFTVATEIPKLQEAEKHLEDISVSYHRAYAFVLGLLNPSFSILSSCYSL
jgi:hypothetical protein